jgi:excinuclease ABC subunit C
MDKTQIQEKLKSLPQLPGSYQFKNEDGTIIYVGKAKNLKKRVSSYFVGSHDAKTSRLVMHIADIEYIITESELDALLLELNLIKRYNPRYNIMLTDDKTYPYIEITNETHPKIRITRTKTTKSKWRFGPYPNASAARETVKILNKIYPLRKCEQLPKEACLYYHMGQCLAPCIKKVEPKAYKDIINDIRHFLKGDIQKTITYLEKQMYQASELLEFERANEYKKMIEAIKTTTTAQKINLNDFVDRDIIGYFYDENIVSIEIFFIRNGKINARHQHVFEYYSNPHYAVENYIAQFYQKEPVPKEILVSKTINTTLLSTYLKTKVLMPQRGDKAKLLKLATINAQEGLKTKSTQIKRELKRTVESVEKLGELLGIPTPYKIEAFDNSNLFGEDAVSSMVTFVNGRPQKKLYRKYKVKTLHNKASDFHTMKEVIYRRYYRVLLEDLPRPDLILLDGGKSQLTAAKEILTSLDLQIPIAGLVKDLNHSTNYLLTEKFEKVELDKTSDLFHLLTRIQDEAHRFAINFHKKLRSKSLFESSLDHIESIGKKTKEKLLQKYKSVNLIKNATIEELLDLGLTKKQVEHLLQFLQKK